MTKPDTLISNWRLFRQEVTLAELSELETLNRVENYFATMPRSSRCIDYYTPKDWPNPWEIFHDKYTCNTSVTLLQYYSLLLLPNINADKIELYLIEDDQDEYVILVYDNKYILNYYFGEVLDFETYKKEFKILYKIDKKEIQKIS